MSGLRFSLARFLAGVMIATLLSGVIRSLTPNASPWSVAVGGLNLCTLFFAALCCAMHSASRTLIFSVIFYFWGWSCLQLTAALDLNGTTRLLLALVGATLAAWAWLGGPQPWAHDLLPSSDRRQKRSV